MKSKMITFKKALSLLVTTALILPLFSMTALAFTLADVTDINLSSYRPLSIWSDGNYIYVGTNAPSTSRELFALSFNGSSYNIEGQITTGFQDGADLWGDSNYIYMAENGNGLGAYSFDGANFTKLDSASNPSNVRGVWGDNTYVFTTGLSEGLFAYTFDGANISAPIDSIATTPNAEAYSVWGDGTYIYVANGQYGIAAYSFDGATFTELHTLDTASLTTALDIWGDGAYIYVSDQTNGVCAYTFNGSIFNEITCSDDTRSNSIVGGDGLIYSASHINGLYAYSFDGANFTLESSIDETANTTYDVWYDGTQYFHVANYNDNRVYAYQNTDYSPPVPEFNKYIYIAAVVLIMGFMVKVIPRARAKA